MASLKLEEYQCSWRGDSGIGMRLSELVDRSQIMEALVRILVFVLRERQSL